MAKELRIYSGGGRTWYWENQIFTCKKNEIGSLSYVCFTFSETLTRSVSKWIKNLNIKHIGKINIKNIGEKSKKLVLEVRLLKLHKFCTVKETMDKLKRQSTEWEKIFTTIYLLRG